MPPKGYFAAPDLAAQKEMWQQAAKAPKDERGVAIDLAAQREATAREERGDKETTVSSLERAGAGLGLKERLAQLRRDLQEDEAAAAYDNMQIEALQGSIKAANAEDLGVHLRGFEQDKLMRMQRAAGYRRQIFDLNLLVEEGGKEQAAA